MKFLLLIPLWRRARLARLVLSYYQRLALEMTAEGTQIELRCVVSPGDPDSYALCESLGISYAEHGNGFLSEKLNAGLYAFRDVGYDAYIKMDSDTFTCRAFFQRARALVEQGARYVIPDSVYFLDAATSECLYVRCRKTGVGRIVHRDLLVEKDFRPYQRGVHLGTDGALCRGLGRTAAFRSLVDIRAKGITILDVKTGTNMWSFDEVKANLGGMFVPAEDVLSAFPVEAPVLLSWNKPAKKEDCGCR